MTIDINWLSVIVATVVGMAIAGFWYSKVGFGKIWRKLTHVTENDSKKAGSAPLVMLLVANFITALILDCTISIAAQFFDDTSIWLALFTSSSLWLAFSMTTLLTHNGFELKPLKLTLLNNSYQFVLFAGMALAIQLT